MKILSVFVFLLIIFMTNNAYAHPDFMGAKIQWANHTEIPHSINVIKKTNQADIVYEIFSEPWFWQNFIFILIGAITLIMGFTILLNFKEDLPWINSG